jgi:hypothetical protein
MMLFLPEVLKALVRLVLALLTVATDIIGAVDPWAVPAQVSNFAP